MPNAVTIDEAKYWKLRMKLADHDRTLQQLQQAADRANEARISILVESGLNPTVDYLLNDETFTATPKG